MSTLYLRPNGAGDYTNIPIQYPNSTYHWDKVDEASPDDDTTYVRCASTTQYKDAYALEDASIPSGSTINSVRVYFRWKYESLTASTYCQPFLRLGTNETAGTEVSNIADWTTFSEILARPGGGTWSIGDISGLQVAIGGRVGTGGTGPAMRCTQVYVEVDYTLSITIDSPLATVDNEALQYVSLQGDVNIFAPRIKLGTWIQRWDE